ncbi:hypothetical protein QCA50_008100 [Cerrena zonata]|uniref:Uncharacterized protein n=1 Tax=Cerrena zonata TaxID=2478898 RepID=A0AAW0GAJ4_9APHY
MTLTSFYRMWGLTAIYAYRAYKERSFLDDAVEIWQAYTPWVISPADAASGSHPLKTTQFSSECNGSTVAGGVFFRIDEGNKGDVSIMAGSDGAYMAYELLFTLN